LVPYPSGDGPEKRHPVSGLRWLRRQPITELKRIDVSTIKYRVHVVPAFTFKDTMKAEDGYLLNHGIYNYDARHPVSPAPQPKSSSGI
jgi:hypothetical protein